MTIIDALNTGGRYNPSTDSWTATSTTNAPAGRDPTHGSLDRRRNDRLGWSAASGPIILNTGGRYNPSTDSWTATNTTNAPAGRFDHTAVWTGSEMIVWGGCTDPLCSNPLNTGGRYNPSTDSWTATSTNNAPSARTVSHGSLDRQRNDRLGRVLLLFEHRWAIQPCHRQLDTHQHHQRARWPRGSHGSVDWQPNDHLGWIWSRHHRFEHRRQVLRGGANTHPDAYANTYSSHQLLTPTASTHPYRYTYFHPDGDPDAEGRCAPTPRARPTPPPRP